MHQALETRFIFIQALCQATVSVCQGCCDRFLANDDAGAPLTIVIISILLLIS